MKCAEDVIAEQAKKDEDDPFANLSKKEKKKKKKMVRVCLCLKVYVSTEGVLPKQSSESTWKLASQIRLKINILSLRQTRSNLGEKGVQLSFDSWLKYFWSV